MQSIFQEEYQVKIGSLLCPNCFAPHSLKTLLHHCSVSWPNQGWVLFSCPQCSKTSHVEVDAHTVTTGLLDGAPGPCFFPCSQITDKDFSVKIEQGGILCRYQGEEYRFAEKE